MCKAGIARMPVLSNSSEPPSGEDVNVNARVTRFNVLGVGISALSLAQARDLVLGARHGARHRFICVSGVHGVTEACEDTDFRRIINRAWLATPDGMPLVWLGRGKGHRNMTRVYGPDLMLEVADAGRAVGLTHYLYGGGPHVAEKLQARLSSRFPGLKVVGTYT